LNSKFEILAKYSFKLLAPILLAALTLLSLPANTSAREKPYTILISFDGFRWDYIERGFSPNLAKLRDEGVGALSLKPVYPSKTFPNHYSIITGQYTDSHGLIANNFNDPFTGERYSLRDPKAVQEARWYLGEAFWETAERQGIICASYFWPGSEMNLDYRRATYFQRYEHERPYEQRVQGVLDWLQLPESKRPLFISLYFDAVDGAGHRFGPEAKETNRAIARVDSMLGLLVDGLQKIGLKQKTNLIVVSDHGMTAIDPARSVNIEAILGDIKCEIEDRGPLMLLRPVNASIERTYRVLKKAEKYYRVYAKKTMPKDFHFSEHPFIPPILLVADLGWSLVTNSKKVRGKGHHGYDHNQLDMHGMFYAAGPSFKKGYRTGTLMNIDIYPLLCEIYEIFPRQNIDGRLERIEAVLQRERE
jgi:predicted AlkP superfamily pyrophosphatase or phosphodiesterase